MNHAMLDIMYFQYNDLLFAALNIASFLNYDKQEAIYFFYCENPIYSYFRQFCISSTFLDDSVVSKEFYSSTEITEYKPYPTACQY